ncbi:MAG: AAA family ATPase [Nitriliruptorales bacterium]|nr:AAA family ATPase [Nitriliruptorales bacterium]
MSQLDVIFIGGAPGSGKSTLGRALATALGYGSLTGDDLAIAARSVTKPGDHPGLHLIGDDGPVGYFTRGPVEKLISDAEAQESALWPALERVALSHLQTKAGVVIDWWLLRPETVLAMGHDRVASLWLAIDPDVLWERERQNTDFLDAADDPERMLDNFMARSLWRNDLVHRQASSLGLPLLSITDQTVAELTAQALDALS